MLMFLRSTRLVATSAIRPLVNPMTSRRPSKAMHRGEPDAARRAVDEQGLAAAEGGTVNEAAPGGLVGETERCAFFEGHEVGQRVGVGLVRHGLLGVGAPVHECEHALADADLGD